MIYQLVEYLSTKIPHIAVTTNGINSKSEDDLVVVTESGGTCDHYTGRIDTNVQFLSRSKSNFRAKSQIGSIFNLINNTFGLVLPEVIIDGELFSAIPTYRIVSMQVPGYIGTSDDNYEMYSFNVIITLNYS